MSPVCFLGSDDINQFNYAKCIVIINSTPKPILVTVTYKDETSKITKNSTIQAWDIHQFRGEIKTCQGEGCQGFNSEERLKPWQPSPWLYHFIRY